MHTFYKDIMDRIDESPTWFDDYSVPRFIPFSPHELSNIYADEAALAEISCQGCGKRFRVALNDQFASREFSLSDTIRLNRVHYGDPPNVECCLPGPSMNSEMHKILEYWARDFGVPLGWRRDSAFEGPVSDEQLEPADTVAELLAALAAGARTVRVACTSQRNRYDLLGRITAAQTRYGRVLVAYSFKEFIMVPHSLKCCLPDQDIGYVKDDRPVTLTTFEKAKDICFPMFDFIVVLAPSQIGCEAALNDWNGISSKSLENRSKRVCIELIVKSAACLVSEPDFYIDAGIYHKVTI